MHYLYYAFAANTNTFLSLVPITFWERLLAQNGDEFYYTIRARLGNEEEVPFVLNLATDLFRSVEGFEEAVIPQSIALHKLE